MSFHPRGAAAPANFVVVMMLALWSAGCGHKKTGDDKPQSAPASVQQPAPTSVQQSAPEPLPAPIVKAWTAAGAAAVWIRQVSPSQVSSGGVMLIPGSKSPKPPKTDDVPAFAFNSLPEGIVAKLPPPQQPFGLVLTGEGSEVTDASLKGLDRLEHLHTLYLDGSKVTDAGLKELAGLKKLRRLSLSERVTDAGLKELAALKELQTLHIDRTQVTDAGVKDLQKALPHCKIIKQ